MRESHVEPVRPDPNCQITFSGRMAAHSSERLAPEQPRRKGRLARINSSTGGVVLAPGRTSYKLVPTRDTFDERSAGARL